MEVILKEDVANLGLRGEVVKVADGYGRNYLLPRKLAMQANDTNKAVIEQMKAAAERRSASEKAQAQELVSKFDNLSLSFTRRAGEQGHLFGSVTSADIAAELAARGFEVDRRKIQLSDPLKGLGEYNMAIRLHREVTAHVTVKVLAEATPEGEASAPAAEEAAAPETTQASFNAASRDAILRASLRSPSPILRTAHRAKGGRREGWEA